MAAACRDVEAATLAHDGSPPITRTTFPTCRAHYPGGSSGCACRLLPRLYSLPQMTGGSASALSLSRPAQASLTLRPAGSLSRPTATFVTRLQPRQLPSRAARQLPDQSTTLRVVPSSTGASRLRGARSKSEVVLGSVHFRLSPRNRHCRAEHIRSARVFQTSTCSAIARASSTSMPRYLTVLSILVWPSKSWTALRFPVRR